jgi:adenylate cyclase, class 2
MVGPRRNIELKAVDLAPARSMDACRTIGAREEGEIWQRDAYFAVPYGGLKLREERPGRPHLIQFERADEAQHRESRYRIVATEDPETMLDALTAAVGLRIVVTKRRRLFLWESVRIHLDDVEGLGTFIELEAVASPESDLSPERELIARLRTAFAIDDSRLLASGYAALLEAARSRFHST